MLIWNNLFQSNNLNAETEIKCQLIQPIRECKMFKKKKVQCTRLTKIIKTWISRIISKFYIVLGLFLLVFVVERDKMQPTQS